MRLVSLLLLLASAAYGAIGDNAPSVPATYKATHPRLGAPGDTYLANVWAQRANASTSTGSKRMFDAADLFDPTTPQTTSGGATLPLQKCRYLLIAYRASKVAGSPSSTYLNKIKALATPGGDWDLTTGTDRWHGSVCMAMAYDWVYDDLDSATKAAFLASFHDLLTKYETFYDANGQTPVNDHMYLDSSQYNIPSLVVALAAYPDDVANGPKHLRHAMDVWLNIIIPTWKKVIGGDGKCGASTDTDIDCGGAWHEPWQSYFAQVGQSSQSQWYVLVNLAWKNASGDDIFTREGWLKNIGYWTMYLTRPDFLQQKVNGAYTNGYNTSEFGTDGFGAYRPSTLEGLAKIYDDPTIRWWARLLDWAGGTPWAYEPSAFPFLDPDTSSTVNVNRSTLSKVRNFPGWGALFFRTGWGEDDTLVTLQYGDSYWSHPMMGTGSFTIYNRGSLVLNSGNYKPGSNSQHFYFYASQAIAHNTLLVNNSAESFPGENNYPVVRFDGSTSNMTLPNDGGQVRNGSGFWVSNGIQRNGPTSPGSPTDLMRDREFYHRAKLVGYAVGTGNKYSAAMIDMTAAYNNTWSHVAHVDYDKHTANTANRTYRVRKAVRYLVFVPRGTSAYVVTYDQVVSADPTYTKKALIHSVNQPVISGNQFTITRNETVTEKFSPSSAWGKTGYRNLITHCPTGTCGASSQYIYDGKLYGWMTQPAAGTLTAVGGAGNEFNVAGTNYNECSQSLCTANSGTGDTADVIKSVPTEMPYEPGGWRIEETMDAARASDSIVNVMLATNGTDTNLVSTAPSTSTVGSNLVTTWKDNGDLCTYTLAVPVDGIGGHLTISGTCVGSQTVDADLLATQAGTDIPAMQWTQVSASGEKIGYVTGNVDGCVYVPALASLSCLDSYRATSSEPNLNWFNYSLEENKVSIASDISKFQNLYWTEGGHPVGVAIDPTNATACGFMANSGGQVSDMSKSTVCFDFLGRVGKNKRTATTPGYNSNQMPCAFDSFRRKQVCWGGDAGLQKLSIYDPSTNSWTIDVATTGTCPTSTTVSMMAFNSHDGKVYLFGGFYSTSTLNGLYTIDISTATPTCTQLSPTGGPPPARVWGGWAYDSSRNLFLLNGGSTTKVAGGGNIYDTWLYDPTANTWTEITSTVGSPGTPNAPPEYRMHYAPEIDTFVMLPQGQIAGQPTFFYYLRLAPGAKIGGTSISRAQSAGQYNKDIGSWAAGGWLAASSTQTLAVFSQFGPTANTFTNASYQHPYVQNITTGSAASVPAVSTYQSLSPDRSGTVVESVDPSIAFVAGVPWACWSEQGNTFSAMVYCKGFSGGAWSLGGQIGGTQFQGQTQVIDFGGSPTVIYRHNDRSIATQPFSVVARVKQFNGSSWVDLGSSGLNIATTGVRVALSVSLATDGTSLWAAWTEYTGATAGNGTSANPYRITYNNTKAYLAKWNSGTSAWDLQCSTYANTVSTGWAEGISAAILGGVPHIAMTERITVSAAPRLFVRKCSGGAWSTVGTGYRNKDQTNGWVWQPKLISHDGLLDLVWDEQANTIPWATNASYEGSAAEPVRVYAARWDGAAWSSLGGALNADTAFGTATMPSIAYGTAPVVLWGETEQGTNRAMYAKQWSGTDWVGLSVPLTATNSISISGAVQIFGSVVFQ